MKFKIFLSAIFTILIIIAGFVFYTRARENENYQALSKQINHYYIDKVYLSNLTKNDLTTLKNKVNHEKLTDGHREILQTNFNLLAFKFDKMSEINHLFEKKTIDGSKMLDVPVKSDLTTDDVNTISLTDLPNDKFRTLLENAQKEANYQFSTISDIKGKLNANLISAQISPLKTEIASVKNATIKKKLNDQLTKLEQNLQIAQLPTTGSDHQKMIALTFDDGPSNLTTPTLLDTLKKYDVKATFCVLGQNVQQFPDIVKRENEQGCEIISHTWDHKDLATLSAADQTAEITGTQKLITQLTGQNNPLFRPPYGSYNSTTLAATNNAVMLWSVDTQDWAQSTSTPVVKAALAGAHPDAVILMHDIHAWSVAAVPQIIASLKAQGYTFVTVSELIKAREGNIQPQTVYSGK